MESFNILSLSEESLSYCQNLNNSGISSKTNYIFKNEIDFPFLLTLKENIFLEEPKNIMHSKHLESESLYNDFSKANKLFKIQKLFKNDNLSTIKTSNNNNISSSTPDISPPEIKKNISFKTVLYHKRGRKDLKKNIGQKSHGAGDADNIERKIQVSYFNFLIRLANDAIKTVFGKKAKYYFKDIKYKLKKIVRHNYIEKLKLCKYSDIVQMKVSRKNRSHGENFNKETYMNICKISPELKKFFDNNYLYIFQKYFCRIKINQDIINFEGLEVKLSPHTNGLFNLLRKNLEEKEKFKEIIKNVYFCNSKYSIENPFISSNPFIISHY